MHVKRSDKETFLFQTPAASEVDPVLREIVKIHNLRGKVNRLAEEAKRLALHGPMKIPEQQGLDDETPLLDDYNESTGTVPPRKPVQHGANYRQDPQEKRTGDCPSDELAAVIQQTVTDAEALTTEAMVARKLTITSAQLEEAISNIRGAVMIVYPMGLPDYDFVRMILEDRENLEGQASMEYFDPEVSSLWCFSKELQRDKVCGAAALSRDPLGAGPDARTRSLPSRTHSVAHRSVQPRVRELPPCNLLFRRPAPMPPLPVTARSNPSPNLAFVWPLAAALRLRGQERQVQGGVQAAEEGCGGASARAGSERGRAEGDDCFLS